MQTRRCAVLGDPIEHSLSPTLHRAGLAAVGLGWSYDRARVASGGLAAFLDGLDSSWRGLSLTMPLKREVVSLCTTISPTARLAGAVNTVVLEDGTLRGDNTDVPGAAAALTAAGIETPGAVTILGGGATATSVGLACLDLGARSVRLLVRSASRAAETRDALAAHPSAGALEVGSLDEAPTGDLLVSTIPAAAQTDALVAAAAGVPALFEVLYDPWPTPLARAAGERGQVLVGGLDLLVAQAVLQFEIFTGLPAPAEVMRAAGLAALAARG